MTAMTATTATTDPVLELLASLNPTGPTFISELKDTLGMKWQTQVQGVVRNARAAGWPLIVHHARRRGWSRGRNAVFIEGRQAEIEAVALHYWKSTYRE